MKTTGAAMLTLLLLTATVVVVRPGAMAQPPKPDTPAPTRANAPSKEDDQTIRKTVAGFEEAWNAHDMKALGKLFAEDAEFINVVGMHWRGRDAIVAAHAAFHETAFRDCRLKTDAVEVRSLGGGHAVAVATVTQDGYTTPAGQVVPKGQFRMTFVLSKTSDGWKIAHGHNVRVDADAAKHDPVNGRRK